MARVLGATSLRTEPLKDGWQFAVTTPGSAPFDAAALDGLDWSAAQVPGTVASALRAQKKFSFDEPHNFDASDVWYRTRFASSPATRGEILQLRFDGLATLADVWLNGQHLLRSENMFLGHAVDVTALVRADNQLLIRFASLDAALAARRPRPRWRTRLVDKQQLRWFRTTLLGRVPAWSPPVATVGPWRPVTLARHTGLLVEETQLRVAVENGAGVVSVRLPLSHVEGAVRGGWLQVGDARGPLAATRTAEGVVLEGTLSLPAPARWWPHTHGAQPAYDARVTIEAATSVEVDLGPVSFRTVEVTDPDRFALRLNDTEIFCRGACWTTSDVVSLAGDTGPILDQVRGAGMNMVRVGGTMVYESDDFYAGCDRRGILVWQDFMFANLDYPGGDEAFRASVRREAEQFLARIETSPSLAVLCGSSEIEQQAAMLGLPSADWKQPLFEDELRGAGRAGRPDVPYLPSTPTGGALPFQLDTGVAHYYGVGAYLRPFEDARRSAVRFSPECLGFANIPEDATLESFLADGQAPFHHPAWKRRVPRDAAAGWDFDDVRDHYTRLLFGVDPVALRYADPDRALSLGRLASGEAMARTFAEWRRSSSTCRGALVWFLRDLWPGAGWGLIDAHGLPKAAYFAVKRVMQPICLLAVDEGLNGLALHALNEGERPVEADLTCTLYRQGDVRVAEGTRRLRIPARGSVEVAGTTLFDHFLDLTYAYRFGPPAFDVAVGRLVDAATGTTLGECFHFPGTLSLERSADLGLEASAEPVDASTWSLSVRTRKLAQAVAIDVRDFIPEDAYFHLAPGAERRVRLQARAPQNKPSGQVRALNGYAPTKIVIRSTA
jgi:beta-mannosidase